MALIMMLFLSGAGVVITGVVDFMSLTNQEHALQAVADRAALAAAQELIVSQSGDERVEAVAQGFVAANYSGKQETGAKIIDNGRAVQVTITAESRAVFSGAFANNAKTLAVEAVAEVSGGGYVCMLGLDEKAVATLNMMNGARLTAEKCAVYSNSLSDKSLWLHDTARVKADLICVAGGVQGPKTAFTMNQPMEDCPKLDDPLRDRPLPTVKDRCDQTNLDVHARDTIRLSPGVYCGGITINGGTVNLDPGVYIIKNGQLRVTNGGTLAGQHVGFFLTGRAATLYFARESHVSLTAPKTGPLSGLLFFEDRSTTFNTYHRITSRDARNLVGTMYFPKSKLMIDSQDPVADRSDYTIVIAREFELRDGPELVLNTDYASSDIPVPKGVGNNTTSSIRLAR